MNIDTITLQSFLTLAETGHVTKTAERVGRTQSAVSQQIAKLEESLGKPLFIRGKSLVLTAEGEVFLGYARQIFELHREAIDRFKKPELEGTVKFGLPEDFASVFLADVLVDFIRIHPRILLNVECDLTLNLFEHFKKKDFDLVLVKMNRPQDFPNGVDVWTEHLEWVGDVHLIKEDKTKPIPLVLSPHPCVYRASAIKALEEAGLPWRVVFSSPSYAGTLAAVKAGLGITVVPRTMVPQELSTISTPHLPLLSDIHVSLLKHQANNPVINSFEEFVLKKIKTSKI